MSEKDIKKAMKHSNRLGAGAKKRKSLNKKDTFEANIKEFKRGTLHSGSGKIVEKESQAKAIAVFESKKKRK